LRGLPSLTPFIAFIASRKRPRLVLDCLRNESVKGSELTPLAGLDLGAKTPEAGRSAGALYTQRTFM